MTLDTSGSVADDTRPAAASPSTACLSCGTPQARMWSTPQGAARLCPPCATLHGIGCP